MNVGEKPDLLSLAGPCTHPDGYVSNEQLMPHCDFEGCKMLEQGFILAGHVDVDAGIVWVGDPCYILPDKRDDDSGLDYMNMLDQWPRVKYTIEDVGAAELHRDALIASGVPEDRAESMSNLFRYRHIDEPANIAVFRHEAGHTGRGVCVHAGYGDGSYPVWVRLQRDEDEPFTRVAEIRAVFI